MFEPACRCDQRRASTAWRLPGGRFSTPPQSSTGTSRRPAEAHPDAGSVFDGLILDQELDDRLVGESGPIRDEDGDAVRIVVTAPQTSPVETWPQQSWLVLVYSPSSELAGALVVQALLGRSRTLAGDAVAGSCPGATDPREQVRAQQLRPSCWHLRCRYPRCRRRDFHGPGLGLGDDLGEPGRADGLFAHQLPGQPGRSVTR